MAFIVPILTSLLLFIRHADLWISRKKSNGRITLKSCFTRYGVLLHHGPPNSERGDHCPQVDKVCILETGLLENDVTMIAMRNLSSRLSLPLLTMDALLTSDTPFPHILNVVPYTHENVNDYAIGISAMVGGNQENLNGKKGKLKLAMKPLFVDFCPPASSPMGRRSNGESGRDLLIKAVAPTKGFGDGAVVYDLTAGLGQDSLLLANAGAKRVHMVERDPVVVVLLEDALRRLQVLADHCTEELTQKRASHLLQCLTLTKSDGTTVAKQLLEKQESLPDIIYLDPMFPER